MTATVQPGLEVLLGLLKDYQGTSLSLWNIYLAVALGVIGFTVAREKPADRRQRVLLVLGFVAFCSGNLAFLERCQHLIHGLSVEIASRAPAWSLSPELASALHGLPHSQSRSILLLHLACDVCVVLAVWLVSTRPRTTAADPTSQRPGV